MTQIDKTQRRAAGRGLDVHAQGAGQLQVTPVVVGGDHVRGRTERVLCARRRQRTGDLALQAPEDRRACRPADSANRGVAVAGDKVFMETDNAHIIALNRLTGELVWDTELADWHKNYSASSAPLPAGNLVISGVAGGEHGANGFVAAHDQETGKEVWRFWTVPKPRRAGIRDLAGQGHRARRRADVVHRQLRSGARPRLLADRQSEQGVQRRPSPGRQLYSDSHPRARSQDRRARSGTTSSRRTISGTGTRPQTSVLVDADWQGQPRKLMLHANRNGFFYVFDRRDGTLLLAKPFVKNLTWASGIGADGRPIRLPNQEPTPAGTKVCPSQDGATNWFSPSFNPATGPVLPADVREMQHLHEAGSGRRGKLARATSAARSERRAIPSRRAC